jgi:hypothetical protein
MEKEQVNRVFELGAVFGRNQAYGSMAKLCSAANAQSLKKMRDEKIFLEVESNWALFCKRRLGISRQLADKIVHLFEEFGPDYFALAEIIRITPDHYRLIAPAVDGNAIHHDGEAITIEPENAPRLAAAAEDLRRAVETRPGQRNPPALDQSLATTERSLRGALSSLQRLNAMELPADGRKRVRGMIGSSLEALKRM